MTDYNKYLKNIGSLIKNLRLQQQWTPELFIKNLNLDLDIELFINIEAGKKDIDIDNYQKILNYFKIDAHETFLKVTNK